MIGYLDTSAFVPLLVAEAGSIGCRRFWNDADDVVASRLLLGETAAALAQAARQSRLTRAAHDRSLELLDQLWAEIDVVEPDDVVVRRASVLARQYALRGYDAVHCASAEQLGADDVVAASGDRKLLDAWSDLGIATFDPNQAG